MANPMDDMIVEVSSRRFVLPWNTPDAEVSRFRPYLDDSIVPERDAIVEITNESWNYDSGEQG
jgi:hypothetical protein